MPDKKKKKKGKVLPHVGDMKNKGNSSKVEDLRNSGVRLPGDNGFPIKPSSRPKIKATHSDIIFKKGGLIQHD